MPPRFDVTPAQIDRVVSQFYRRVRQHPVLGPVFASHVSEWSPHEAKIVGFWANAILRTRAYDGNPMQTHMAAQNVKAEHFTVWLALFDEVLQQELPADTARTWSAFAHRIGKGLRMGVEDFRAPVGAIPRI